MKILFAILLVPLLSACSPSIEKVSEEDAQKEADSMTYVKSRHGHGLCFGLTETSRMSSSGSIANALLIVNVNCKDVDL